VKNRLASCISQERQKQSRISAVLSHKESILKVNYLGSSFLIYFPYIKIEIVNEDFAKLIKLRNSTTEETKESDDFCYLSPYKSKIIHSNLLFSCIFVIISLVSRNYKSKTHFQL
jgi:hypothetical protein